MMNCQEVMDLLMEQPLEDLADEPKAGVQTHLDVCGPCDGFVESFNAVAPMVRKALEVEVDDALQAELDAAVMEALRREA
jgi:hypothetical protein